GPEKGAAGMGAVLIDRDAPGLTFGPQENLMGFRGIGSADMFLTDVRVPVTDIIVPKGGFRKLFTAFSIERLGNATMSLAVGQTALDRTARYVRERHQFGREISEFQMVQSSVADMVVQVEAARLLIARAAVNAGTGAPDPLEASVAKCFANEMAKRVSDLAMQMHGGYGYSEEYEIERLHRDAHGWALAGGTPAMQRIRIASEYLGRRYDQRGNRQ
ncbi:MAG: acyl-CoA dehydrogenase, partial [Comamonadaceae bacterium]